MVLILGSITTIHELAHASHWGFSQWHYNNAQDIVVESYARGIEWELTNVFYPGYNGGSNMAHEYTSLVLDLIDNPDDSNNGSENLSQDNVSGYTIRQIEDALLEKTTWSEWEQSIYNKFNNPTKEYLDELFNHWR